MVTAEAPLLLFARHRDPLRKLQGAPSGASDVLSKDENEPTTVFDRDEDLPVDDDVLRGLVRNRDSNLRYRVYRLSLIHI